MRGTLGAGGARGISLIEMVIAVLVLSIGVVAGYRTLGQAQRGIGEELPRLLARTAALNRAEELRLLGMEAGRGLPAEVTVGPLLLQIEVTEKPTEGGFTEATVKAGAAGLPGALTVVFVRPPPEPATGVN